MSYILICVISLFTCVLAQPKLSAWHNCYIIRFGNVTQLLFDHSPLCSMLIHHTSWFSSNHQHPWRFLLFLFLFLFCFEEGKKKLFSTKSICNHRDLNFSPVAAFVCYQKWMKNHHLGPYSPNMHHWYFTSNLLMLANNNTIKVHS